MKKILCIALTLMSLGAFAQNDQGSVNETDNVYIFMESAPTAPYRHLGLIEASTYAPMKERARITHMIKRTRKEYPEFNGLIFRPGTNFGQADVIQFNNPPKTKRGRSRSKEIPKDPLNKLSKANTIKGFLIFIQGSPTTEFNLLGEVNLPATYDNEESNKLIPEMVKTVKETYPDAEGIIFIVGSDLRKADVIKFK